MSPRLGRLQVLAVALSVGLLACALWAAPGAAGKSLSAKCRAGEGTPWRFIYPPSGQDGFVGHWYQIAVYEHVEGAGEGLYAPNHLCGFIRHSLGKLTRVKNHRNHRIRIASPGQDFTCVEGPNMFAQTNYQAGNYDQGAIECKRTLESVQHGKVLQKFRIVPEPIYNCDYYFDAQGQHSTSACVTPPADAGSGF